MADQKSGRSRMSGHVLPRVFRSRTAPCGSIAVASGGLTAIHEPLGRDGAQAWSGTNRRPADVIDWCSV